MQDNYKKIWDENHKKFLERGVGNIQIYDGWLNDFSEIWQNSKLPIIDLGCGVSGNNTNFLLKNHKKVIACDFSEVVIETIEKYFPEAKTKLFDMANGLPFESQSTELVIADLSLHYFDDKTTEKIIADIWKVLTPGGHLLFRLNSVNTSECRELLKSKEQEVEKNFFHSKNILKRFFDRNDIEKYFKDWHIFFLDEESMGRYGSDKKVWKCGARKVV